MSSLYRSLRGRAAQAQRYAWLLERYVRVSTMRVAILILVVLSQVCGRCFGAPEEARKLLEMGAPAIMEPHAYKVSSA